MRSVKKYIQKGDLVEYCSNYIIITIAFSLFHHPWQQENIRYSFPPFSVRLPSWTVLFSSVRAPPKYSSPGARNHFSSSRKSPRPFCFDLPISRISHVCCCSVPIFLCVISKMKIISNGLLRSVQNCTGTYYENWEGFELFALNHFWNQKITPF